MTIYGITTKFGIRMCPYPAFQFTNFQGNQIILLYTFIPWWNEEKKITRRRKTKPILKGSYLRFAWDMICLAWFSWILECEVMKLAGISTAKIVLLCQSVMELRMRENYIIVLPVNNSRVCRAGFLGCTTQYQLSWFLFYNLQFKPVKHLIGVANFIAIDNQHKGITYES